MFDVGDLCSNVNSDTVNAFRLLFSRLHSEKIVFQKSGANFCVWFAAYCLYRYAFQV